MSINKILKGAVIFSAITAGSTGLVLGIEAINQRPWLAEEQKVLEQRIAQLDRFPGNLDDYNKRKGVEYEIIDTGSNRMYVIDDANDEILSSLVQQGCEGLIYWQRINDIKYFGVPVREK